MIIGVAGLAQSGKDSFFELITSEFVNEKDIEGTPSFLKHSFADEVKQDLDSFVKEKFGFSAFTEVKEEKDIIRPLLVTWGTHVMRKIDEDHWIKKMMPKLESGLINVITDVRYPNECSWIKKHLKGKVIHLTREGVTPPNEEEAKNDPILKEMSDKRLYWETFLEKDDLKKAYGTICKNILNTFLEEFLLTS